MTATLARAGEFRPESIGTDAWGCDYGLLRDDGTLVEAPFTYRDPRTDGVMEQVFAKRVPRTDLRDDRYPVSLVQHAVSAVCGMPLDT